MLLKAKKLSLTCVLCFYIVLLQLATVCILVYTSSYRLSGLATVTVVSDDISKYGHNNDARLSSININLRKDFLAFVHIQKTSGTFWEQLFRDNLYMYLNDTWTRVCNFQNKTNEYVCVKTDDENPIYFERRYLQLCDIHADYTELTNCIMYHQGIRIPSRYFETENIGAIHFLTLLRDPIHRYVSEYKHVKRGATWKYAVRKCRTQKIYSQTCFSLHNDWQNATFGEFLSCEYNLANNRQVRMLANYNRLGCDGLQCATKLENCTKEQNQMQEQLLLYSAKETLLSFSFFGLAEYQSQSQYLFEKTFTNKLKFNIKIKSRNSSNYKSEFNEYLPQIIEKNKLDIQLYEFAKIIFFKRVDFFKSSENDGRKI